MSDGNKTLKLSTSGVEFLFSIVNSEKANTKPAINKLRTVFAAIAPVRKAYQTKGDELRKSMREERTMKDPSGNETVGYVIPEAKAEQYEEAKRALQEEVVELTFDRESLAFVKSMVDHVFERADLKDGINNETQITLFAEVSGAIDKASGVKQDDTAISGVAEGGAVGSEDVATA